MKKKYLLLLGLMLCGCIGLAGIMKISEASKNKQLKDYTAKYTKIDENYIGADFTEGEIAYRLDEAISENINTFECWIRMDKNEHTTTQKSVIFGSYCYYNSLNSNNKFVNWEVTPEGNVSVWWAGTRITFTSVDVRNSEWTHVSVVRDEEQQKFLLYINGEYSETAADYTSADTSGNFYRQRIGGDSTEGQRKSPFWGEIGQITCYSKARTAEEIKQDYQEYDSISHETRDRSLLFHAMLQIGDTVAFDRSVNCNNGQLITNDYYYEEELYPTGDYSFAVIGDTQKLARANTAALGSYTDWILDNQEERKISAVMHMGDLTDGTGSSSETEWNSFWENIAFPMKEISAKVPFFFVPGNHDYKQDALTRDLTKFNEYFPYEEQASLTYYGGSYQEGQTQNTYYLMECGDIPYVFIALEFGADSSVMEWVCDVMEQYSERRVVLITHGFLDCAGELYDDGKYLSADWYFSRSNQEATSSLEMWEKYLSKHDNLFMILCGHSVTESIAYKELEGENGNTVMTFRIDPSYVVAGQGLDSITALFSLDEEESKLYLNYFSIDKNKLYNIQNQMVIDYSDFTDYTGSYYAKAGE